MYARVGAEDAWAQRKRSATQYGGAELCLMLDDGLSAAKRGDTKHFRECECKVESVQIEGYCDAEKHVRAEFRLVPKARDDL